MFSQFHMLLPVRQEVYDPPTDEIRHIQLGELVLWQSWDDCIERQTEVYKQDPGMVS